MKTIKIISVFAVWCIVLTSSFAQPDLPSEEVKVIQDFEARLLDSEKLSLFPELPPEEENLKELTYTIPVKTLQLEYLPPKIRPLAIRAKKEEPGFNGYLKAGYGAPRSSIGEFSYSLIDPKQYIFGIHLNHHAANYKTLEHQRFMNNSGEFNGTYYLDNGLAVGGTVGVDNRQLHFYGYDHTEQVYDRSDVRQKFNKVHAKGHIFNGVRNYGDINYKGEIGFYKLTDNYTAAETGFNLHASGTKWFNEKHPLKLDIIADFTNPNRLLTNDINNFYIQPNFTWHAERFRIKAGVNAAFGSDNAYLFPDAEVAVNIIGNKLAIYIGAGGDLQKNTLLSLSDYNPWIATTGELSLRNTSYYHFFGGVKGNLALVDYQIEAGFKPTDDLALFLNNPSDTLRFDVLYDTVDIFNITGSITAMPITNLELTVTLGQNIYDPKNEDKAWHLPIFNTNISARYTSLESKLILKGELFVENGVPYKDIQTGEIDNLNGLFDLSIGAEYRVAKNIGVFLDLNNLASNNRQRWYRYPTYGANILGGITARF